MCDGHSSTLQTSHIHHFMFFNFILSPRAQTEWRWRSAFEGDIQSWDCARQVSLWHIITIKSSIMYWFHIHVFYAIKQAIVNRRDLFMLTAGGTFLHTLIIVRIICVSSTIEGLQRGWERTVEGRVFSPAGRGNVWSSSLLCHVLLSLMLSFYSVLYSISMRPSVIYRNWIVIREQNSFH